MSTGLKFFDHEVLEKIYGKSIDTISPVDQPLDKYMVGNQTITCSWCNQDLKTFCGGFDGLVEKAYCESCHLEHKRRREPLTKGDYTANYQRTDEREEYICPHCKQRKPFVKATTKEFEIVERPKITSYEKVTIDCFCGKILNIGDKQLPFTIRCSNCLREYSFNINNIRK